MSTKVIQGLEALEKKKQGVDLIADTVSTTLGPMGNNVGIDKGFEVVPMHDGVTIARMVDPKDPGINWAVRIMRQSANKQVEEVGDGTTVTTLLAQAIYSSAQELVIAGTNPMLLKKGLNQGAKLLKEELKKLAIPVDLLETKISVATISAEDEELGQIIGQELDKIGLDGILTVEESKSIDTYLEHQDGMQFDKGYLSPLFVTNTDRMEATIENADILITDRIIVNNFELVPLFQKMVAAGKRNLVIIASDITDSAKGQSIFTKQTGEMNILAVQAPQLNEIQKDFLQDLAILTGGEVISGDAQQRIENVEISQLGHARRVTSTKDATLIVDGEGDKDLVLGRLNSIRSLLDRHEGSAFQQEKLRERIAKLGSGVSIIKVGGQTESEWQEKKERAIDSVAATRAAIKAGIVPGGEIVYLLAREVLDTKELSGKILFQALEQPFNKLVANAGFDPGEIRAKRVYNQGFDVTDGEFKDMVLSGIIDPVLVPIQAISNAVSVAIQLLTTKKIIVPDLEDVKK